MRRVVVVAALALTGAASSIAAPQDRHRVVELLDRYDRGEFDAVVQSLVTAREVEGLRKDLEKSGLKWTMAAGPAAEPRRRLVAATLALEFANARLEDEWQKLRSLVEWGCELLRRGPPSDSERTWQLASLAVAQGALDSHILFKLSGPGKSYNHLAHARERFPDEPRLAFAERFAVTRMVAGRGELSLEAGQEPDADRMTPPALGGAGRVIVMPSSPGSAVDSMSSEIRARQNQADARMARETSLRRLRALFDDPVMGPEAALRAGHVWLIGLELEPALEAFQVARRGSSNAYVTYLAHFLRGRVLERLERPEEAERAYAAAADTIPFAQSAALARASLLMRAGRTAEAHALTRASFDAKPRPPDPWRLFPYGDYYRWPALIAELRRAMGQ